MYVLCSKLHLSIKYIIMDEDTQINNDVDLVRENSIDWDEVEREHDCHASPEDGCVACYNSKLTKV